MCANRILKEVLIGFWSKFGGRKNSGIGFDPQLKLEALIEAAQVQIPYHNQQALEVRREKFNEARSTLHPWSRFGICFVCGATATVRHHIIQLQNGGINSKKNVVSLCDQCHCKIHPWLNNSDSVPQPVYSGKNNGLGFIPAWLDDAGLSVSQFRVYCHVCRRGNCFASLKSMSKRCGMDRKTVQRALSYLVTRNMIAKETRQGETCIYTPVSKP